MNRKTKLLLLIGLPILGILAGYLLMSRTVTIIADDDTREVTTSALTVRGALRSAGIRISDLDQVSPPADSWLSKTTEIVLDRSHKIKVWVDPESRLVDADTAAKTPRGILAAAGITAADDDLVRINGSVITLDKELTNFSGTLQYTPAIPYSYNMNGNPQTARTTAFTIGSALWQEGIQVKAGDELSIPFYALVTFGDQINITRSIPVEITADGKVITAFVAAKTVGEAFLRAGVPLQNLDYSKPAETEPIPADGKIKVVRVREEVILEQKSVPYAVEYVAVDDLELDQTKVVEPGEFGIQAARVRVRYEDGVETSRATQDFVTLKQPVTRKLGYGTKIVYKTIDTADGPITYYRAITVTATSYSPCNSGVPECLYGTASGVPVKKGVIAVHLAWYRLLKGSQLYVPGYGIGTIADTGAYPYNNYWIDLGFTDAEFALYGKFYKSITVYFLAPAPPNVPGILP